MLKYVAFLRAINVGGHTVKMDHLRRLFEALEFSNVETFIASGNVIFDSSSKSTRALEKRIESLLLEELGYAVATFIRSTTDLASIAEYKPFEEELKSEGGALYIGFLAEKPNDQATRNLIACATRVDDFHVFGREVYWRCRTKFSETAFSGARLEKTLGMQTTLRNWNTVKRLASKYP
ncbi:MAG TPA: DUF1697 domain-containing protein [Blastocatellia bacterium]|nr:DUF1697 domain-containing protein [Blastocatellia bacterium]